MTVRFGCWPSAAVLRVTRPHKAMVSHFDMEQYLTEVIFPLDHEVLNRRHPEASLEFLMRRICFLAPRQYSQRTSIPCGLAICQFHAVWNSDVTLLANAFCAHIAKLAAPTPVCQHQTRETFLLKRVSNKQRQRSRGTNKSHLLRLPASDMKRRWPTRRMHDSGRSPAAEAFHGTGGAALCRGDRNTRPRTCG